MNNDIVSLLYQIKENIKSLNEDNHREQLNKIKIDYLELMELIKLFLISERNTYYGYFLMNMRFDIDFEADMIAGVKLNTFPPVLKSNPLNLCRFKLKEILYIICHEIDHIVLNHPKEMANMNPSNNPEVHYKLNLATDAAVNDRLNEEIKHKNKYLSKPDGVVDSQALAKMFKLKNVRELENFVYYYYLIRDLDLGENKNQCDYIIDGLGDAYMPMDYDSEASDYKISSNESSMIDHDWDDGDSTLDIGDLVKEFINSTASMIGEKSRGLMPSSFLEQIEKINQPPKLSWKQILKKYVGTVTAGKRKTRTRLNRRQPERFDISGRVDEKVIKIVVAIDTSGSMSNEQIADIFNEIFGILATRKHEITVIECDAVVQRVYKVKNKDDVKMKVMGRGGTSFTPVIEYINNHKYFRDALLIYFTDGYGDNEIPKPLTYRNIWVLTESDNLSVENPYGIVLKMD